MVNLKILFILLQQQKHGKAYDFIDSSKAQDVTIFDD